MNKNKSETKLYNFICSVIKKIFVNVFTIHKFKKIEFVLTGFLIILTLSLTLYHKKLILIFFAPSYIYIKSFFQVVASKAIAWKYRHLSNIFDDKVSVLEVVDSKFVLSSFVTLEEIQRKKGQLEVFFNQEIDSIKRNQRNLRIITIELKKEKVKIKKIYKLIDYIEKTPVKADSASFLMGVDESGGVVVCDLIKLKHMLISGEMGGGKTTFLHALIQSLMYYSRDLAFFLIDFKRVSFTSYKNFDNCYFVKEYKIFFELLINLNEEMNRRYDLLEEKEVENIEHYSKITKIKTARIILIIDEIADLKLSKSIDNDKMEEILTRLINMGRAAGIHVIAATQRPSGYQLSTEIRAGLISKVSFSVFDPLTQKMTGVKGTENLKTGEFMTSHIRKLSGIYKGFYLDKEKSNETFKQLKNKKTNIINLEKNTIYSGSKNGTKDGSLKIKTTSKQVIELINKYKNIKNNNFSSDEPFSEANIYNTFLDYIKNNRKGNKMPKGKDIEEQLKISSKKRKELARKAYDEGILTKPTENSYEFVS